jgi:hypothetical protein
MSDETTTEDTVPPSIAEIVNKVAAEHNQHNLVEVKGDGPLVVTADQNERLLAAATKMQEAVELLREVLDKAAAEDAPEKDDLAKLGVLIGMVGMQLADLGEHATVSDGNVESHIALSLPDT